MRIRPFEIGLIAFFAIAAIGGLIMFSTYKGTSPEDEIGPVVIWGTFDAQLMQRLLVDLSDTNEVFSVVSYVKKDPRTFDDVLINAIAEGRSPDLILIPHTKLVTLRKKLSPISYDNFPERELNDLYIDGAEVFMRSDGLYGIPIAADPLVMYWNRDIFSTSGLAQPPKTWSTLMNQTTKAINVIEDNRGITRSAVALGEYSNILHAKDILSMLFLQTGSTIVEESGARYKVTLKENVFNRNIQPAETVLNFYTQFALSNRELYSWNRSKEYDRKEFLQGDLALYFGPGSEYGSIERDNVNLNFDIAPVPQDSDATILRNYADFYAFAIPRASKNSSGAYKIARYLTASGPAQQLADMYNLVPVLRSLHTGETGDKVKNITYTQALIARGWLDPAPEESAEIFQDMVEKVTSGQARVTNIISDTVQRLENLF